MYISAEGNEQIYRLVNKPARFAPINHLRHHPEITPRRFYPLPQLQVRLHHHSLREACGRGLPPPGHAPQHYSSWASMSRARSAQPVRHRALLVKHDPVKTRSCAPTLKTTAPLLKDQTVAGFNSLLHLRVLFPLPRVCAGAFVPENVRGERWMRDGGLQ